MGVAAVRDFWRGSGCGISLETCTTGWLRPGGRGEFLARFLDTETGEAVTISREVLCAVEDGEDEEEEDVPGWQDEEWETAREILATNRYMRLPDSAEIPEWRWMSEFAGTMAKPGQRAWFAHRDAELRRFAAEWLSARGIGWRE